jgi:hypothetical protein
VKRERKETERMSKVSRDRKKAEAAGKKPQRKAKALDALEEPKAKKEPEEKGLTAACCRCRSYRKKTDDGPKCQKTGKNVARKFLCGDF